MHFLTLALLAVADLASSAPFNTAGHVVHEKRTTIPTEFTQGDRVPHDTILPVRIGLAQSNLQHGYAALMDVADPDSPNFGKHWSPKKIVDFFAPSRQSIDAVSNWLSSAGIKDFEVATNLGWIEFEAPAAHVEELLRTEYHMYDHARGSKPHVGCREYSLPAEIREHVDIITPTVHFDGKPEGPAHESKKRKREVVLQR